jgi:hypothetical protein
MGAKPKTITLDMDATLVTAYSEKDQAAGNYKHGFGFHPMLCYLDETDEGLAGKLRSGNAGANNVLDHLVVLDNPLDQLPITEDERSAIVVRTDSAGASHDFVQGVRDRGLHFSVGFDLTATVRVEILAMPEKAWVPAIRQDGEDRDGADVCELTGLDLSGWPEGTRAICRREEPHPGAQLTFTDIDGHRFQVFITDQADHDIAYLEARHRGHARVENNIRNGKESGMRNLPFHAFSANAVWLELVLMGQDLMSWFRHLCLDGAAARWEPKRISNRLLHTAARLVRTGQTGDSPIATYVALGRHPASCIRSRPRAAITHLTAREPLTPPEPTTTSRRFSPTRHVQGSGGTSPMATRLSRIRSSVLFSCRGYVRRRSPSSRIWAGTTCAWNFGSFCSIEAKAEHPSPVHGPEQGKAYASSKRLATGTQAFRSWTSRSKMKFMSLFITMTLSV